MAQVRLDHVNVVDVESTCWEGSPPRGEEPEIIEIGVCVLDVRSLEVRRGESILVRPERSTVSEFCARLTTLTQADVEQGISFAEACDLLRQRYDSRNHVWASYGDYDRTVFERQCAATGAVYPFARRHVNVKAWFALSHALSREVGMAEALARLGLPLEGTHHRGGDDARNIARILAALWRSVRGQ